MPNREERAYFDGLKVIDDYLPDEHYWRQKWLNDFEQGHGSDEWRERRCAFKLYINLIHTTRVSSTASHCTQPIGLTGTVCSARATTS